MKRLAGDFNENHKRGKSTREGSIPIFGKHRAVLGERDVYFVRVSCMQQFRLTLGFLRVVDFAFFGACQSRLRLGFLSSFA